MKILISTLILKRFRGTGNSLRSIPKSTERAKLYPAFVLSIRNIQYSFIPITICHSWPMSKTLFKFSFIFQIVISLLIIARRWLELFIVISSITTARILYWAPVLTVFTYSLFFLIQSFLFYSSSSCKHTSRIFVIFWGSKFYFHNIIYVPL